MQLPADQDMLDADSIEVATDIVPEATDEILLDASNYYNNKLGLSVINAVNENTRMEESYATTPTVEQNQEEFPAPESEIELYDELGNRIKATIVTVIDGDVTMSNDSSPVNIISLDQVTRTSSPDTRGMFNFIYNIIINYL